jgi:hypothetical protein
VARAVVSETPRASHLIRRGDVPRWLAGPAVDFVTIHQMTASDARLIRETGVRIERTARDAAWGQGFYTTTRPDWQYGEVSVPVAVRLMQPFVAQDPIDGQEQIDAMLAGAQADDVRAVLLAAGFDGVIVHRPWRDEVWVIAYHDHQVRIVEDV